MTDKDDDPEPETYQGHPITKIPPAYAEGVTQGPTAKPRGRNRKRD